MKTSKGIKFSQYVKRQRLIQDKALINKKAQEAYLMYAMEALKNTARGNYMPVWGDLTIDQTNAWRKVVTKLLA